MRCVPCLAMVPALCAPLRAARRLPCADCGGHAALYHPAALLEHAKTKAKEVLGVGQGGELSCWIHAARSCSILAGSILAV